MTSFGGKTINVCKVKDDMHGIITANEATAWHFDPDMEAEVCGVSQCHHVHTELLCDQCIVAPIYPMSEERAHVTSRFSYTIYIYDNKSVFWKSVKYSANF